jgi:hypothetical protein
VGAATVKIEAGDWMESKTTPGAFLEVLEVADDGGASVRADGKTVNTTVNYLRSAWLPMGGDA